MYKKEYGLVGDLITIDSFSGDDSTYYFQILGTYKNKSNKETYYLVKSPLDLVITDLIPYGAETPVIVNKGEWVRDWEEWIKNQEIENEGEVSLNPNVDFNEISVTWLPTSITTLIEKDKLEIVIDQIRREVNE